MGTEIDIKRVTRYPPEVFVSAAKTDLLAGDTKVATYVVPEEYVLGITGLAFNSLSQGAFYINVDGITEYLRLDSLAFADLRREIPAKVVATRTAELHLFTPAGQLSYLWRHNAAVFRRNVAIKELLGITMTESEKRLSEKFRIGKLLKLRPPVPFDLTEGITEQRSVVVSLSVPGKFFRYTVPKGMKAIVTGIKYSTGDGILALERDSVPDTLVLATSCLPHVTSPLTHYFRVVATDYFELDWRGPGSLEAEIYFGLGPLTLTDKVAWKMPLTDEERREAEAENLFEKVEAGIS